MLRSILLASSAVAALLLASCERDSAEAQKVDDAQVTELATKPAPTAMERTTAEAGNEVEQAASPNTQFSEAELAAGIGAENVPNPETALSTAAVKTSSGQALGEVRSVVVGPDGKADAVIVEVGGFLNVGERAVSIDATKFTYLSERNILVGALTKADVEKMPTATQQ